ncbi:MAG: hypothetical protein EBU01_00205 [Crocinitomicaceae bacterium]|nr:hypothetical protein [Crocinitomicaceae bacterium]NCA19566.1 hypothetical protein [Crocinitomicaceae bacterium]
MNYILGLFFLMINTVAFSQIGTGEWRFHTATSKAIDVAATEDKIYVALENGLITLDITKNDETELFNILNVLSDVSISRLYWDETEAALFIGYENGNIDKLKNGKIYNIPAIKLATIASSKRINGFIRFQDFIYVSTDFAIIQLNPTKNEVKDSFYPTNGVEKINDVSFAGDTILALTPTKLLRGLINNPAIAAPSEWTTDNRLQVLTQNQYKEIDEVNGNQFVLFQHTDYGKDSLFVLTNSGKLIVSESPFSLEINSLNPISTNQIAINLEGGIFVYDALTFESVSGYNNSNLGINMSISRSGINSKGMWASDLSNCLYFMPTEVAYKNYKVSGSSNNFFYSIDSQEGKIAIASGFLNGKFPAFTKNGIHFFEDGEWSFTNANEQSCWQGKNIWDFLDVSINPKNLNEYAVCTPSEVPVTIFNDTNCSVYSDTNSTLQLSISGSGWYFVSDVCFDKKGNLWCLNGYADKPLNVRTNKGEWFNFDLGTSAKNKYTKKMIVDFQGNIWCATDNDGLFGYNTNGSISDISDDKRINLRMGENYGNLPSENITALAADFDGEIWIGTDAGFAILYNANSAFDASAGEYDAQRIKVKFEGNVEYVLGSTHITDIEVDGGNRKWIATANAGVLLLSQDGSEILEQYTTDNSPLISNTIFDLKLDQTTGELFIITDKGLLSFRTNATYEDTDYSDVVVFPNPVRPNYFGPITMQGIRYNSDVKITDVVGNLVYKTTSNGGTATWDGKTLDGQKAATGVYLIWTATNEGKDKKVGKVLLVK